MQHCTTQFEPGELKVADGHCQEVWLSHRYISSTGLTRVAALQDRADPSNRENRKTENMGEI
jgi:hypothetical protein